MQINEAIGPAYSGLEEAKADVVGMFGLDWLIEHLRRPAGPVLVFSRTKIGADRLARRLAAAGIRCAALHADR